MRQSIRCTEQIFPVSSRYESWYVLCWALLSFQPDWTDCRLMDCPVLPESGAGLWEDPVDEWTSQHKWKPFHRNTSGRFWMDPCRTFFTQRSLLSSRFFSLSRCFPCVWVTRAAGSDEWRIWDERNTLWEGKRVRNTFLLIPGKREERGFVWGSWQGFQSTASSSPGRGMSFSLSFVECVASSSNRLESEAGG